MLNPDYRDILSAFGAEGVEYLIDGVTFEEAWAARKEIRVDGMPIPVIGREDFLRNKRATGRLKDLADEERLETGDGDGQEPGRE